MPFTHINTCGWVLEIDRAATAHAYEDLSVGCTCAYCRNFLVAANHLPDQVHGVLKPLGIDGAKPAEIVEYNQNPDGSHFYGWWYHAVGSILSDQQVAKDQFGQTQLCQGINLIISARDDLVAAHFPRPVVQIEFFGNLPWLLGEPPDSGS